MFEPEGGLVGMLFPLFFTCIVLYLLIRFICGRISRHVSSDDFEALDTKVAQLGNRLDDLAKRFERYETLHSIESEMQRVRAEMDAVSKGLAQFTAPVDNQSSSSVFSATFPAHVGIYELAYKYEDVKIDLLPNTDLTVLLGKEITFKRGNKIEVYCFSVLVGALPVSKLARMVSDWLYNEEPYKAVVTRINTETAYCSLDIAFYRDIDDSDEDDDEAFDDIP